MLLEYTQPTNNCHQFRVPGDNDETIAMLVTNEGIIIDIEEMPVVVELIVEIANLLG